MPTILLVINPPLDIQIFLCPDTQIKAGNFPNDSWKNEKRITEINGKYINFHGRGRCGRLYRDSLGTYLRLVDEIIS